MTWKSRRKYRTPKGVGHIWIMGDGAVVLVAGQKHMIPRELADGIKSLEKRFADAGRPELFPGKETSTHGITLPNEIWARIPRPYSAVICDLIERNVGKIPGLIFTTEGE
jgi:hypothetical protein